MPRRFLEPRQKTARLIDSKLNRYITLRKAGNEFSMVGHTIHEITKPVIAYSTNPYCVMDWGDLNDPLLESLRRSGALVLIFDHDPDQLDGQKLQNEIDKSLPMLKPHHEKSIPIQLFDNASLGSEIAKAKNLSHEILKWCDGVCIPGGGDVEPSLYGKQKDSNWAFYGQDMMEAGAIYEAMQTHKPVVGICRGAQLTAVVNGGTLKNVNGQWGFKQFERIPEKGSSEYQLFEAILWR